MRTARFPILLAALTAVLTACSVGDVVTIPSGLPDDGYVAFTSETTKRTGFVLSLDASGRELGRTTTDFQEIRKISSSPTTLALWGDLSNDVGIVSRDGAIKRTHTLDRRGYSGFTGLRISATRVIGIMNDGIGNDGFYQMVPISQDLNGDNQTRGLVHLYVSSFVLDGSDLLLAGSQDDLQATHSALARYTPAGDKIVQQVIEPKYRECSGMTRIGNSLFQACIPRDLHDFETVLRSVDATTFQEVTAIDLKQPIHALITTDKGELLAAVGSDIVRFDTELNRLSDDPVPRSGGLSLGDVQSAYELDGAWFLILKGARLDLGESMTHLATLVTVDLGTGSVTKVLPINLDRTSDMATFTIVPAAWFTQRK
ncbi:MAG: hypothetical protein IPL43_15135 [Micropruina sp.]|nr:hypothetical protein [Micropruina sp.]